MPEDDREPTPEDAPLSDLADRVASRRGRDGDASPREAEPSDGAAPREPPADGDEAAGAAEGSAPLSDLARRVGERRRRCESGSNADDLFDEMNVGEVDEETLWASLADSEAAEATHVGAGGDAPVEEVREDVPGYDEHLVPKAEFCAQCPYLSDPPELACDHEGTEIVEVADSETFRVRDCPMVEDE